MFKVGGGYEKLLILEMIENDKCINECLELQAILNKMNKMLEDLMSEKFEEDLKPKTIDDIVELETRPLLFLSSPFCETETDMEVYEKKPLNFDFLKANEKHSKAYGHKFQKGKFL